MTKKTLSQRNQNTTIWISGITASGKTTLGNNLAKKLKNYGIKNLDFLDGEDIRNRLDRSYGHSEKERRKAFPKMLEIIKQSYFEGNIVIVSTVSHKRYMREAARKNFKNFMEIYLRCPSDTCSERDFKGLYKKAINGEIDLFPGITEPYEESLNEPELVLDTSILSIEECSEKLFKLTLKFLKTHT